MRQNTGVLEKLRSRFERNKLGELLVQRGKLTPEQLRLALKTQKTNGKSLGQIAQELQFVSKNDIRTTLFEQAAYRAVTASFTILIGLSSFGIASTAKAGPLNAKTQFTQQSMIHKAAFHPGGQALQPLKAYPKLFGASEIASSDISAFKKWTDILSRLDKVSFKDPKTEYLRTLPLSEKVSAVNQYVNKFKYIEDKNNFGKTDYWATPTEFFARGGDCEDFAIAKYAMLKELGVPENRLRLAIVQDTVKNIPHAILIVYEDDGAVFLDNQYKTAKQVASVERYKPIYSINANGWWRHIT